jgi:DNA topoisomerase III
MRLTVAEKPKVAAEIARVLGATNRADGYFYGGGEIVTWVIGHLVELAEPQDYDSSLAEWRRETLPFIPTEFAYNVQPDKLGQFNVIKSLLHSADVTEVVNACDAAREGELIFDLVCTQAGSTKPRKRLWMSSNTDDDIRAAYANLRPASEYAGLLAAAHARQRGDWLVGINGTRALTLAGGGRRTYSLGRVITPTVALVVTRDEEIENFTPVPYFEVAVTFQGATSPYVGYYFVPPPQHVGTQEKRVFRFDEQAAAETLVAQLPATGIVLSTTEREVSIQQPLLFDLTQLQRQANIRFGFTAQQTLDAAQLLWDSKLITYPRSASQHLSTALNAEIDRHLEPLAGLGGEYEQLALAARHVRVNGLTLGKRHVDDKKLTEGHHAIIPSGQTPDMGALPDTARKLYELIARRFLAAFFPAARDARTEIITSCGSHQFLTRGVREVSAGWREIDPPTRAEEEKGDDDPSEETTAQLPKLAQGESVRKNSARSLSKKTRSPQRYTEASLLEAMDSAGKHCETEEERQAMKECGLGTVATRAQTITRCFKLAYFEKEGKRFIRSSAVAREVVRRLRAAGSLLVSPALTGKWEAELARVANGARDAGKFNGGVLQLTRKTVEEIFASADAPGSTAVFEAAESVGNCPQCAREGRAGQLRARSGASGKFLSCSLPRGECGYISDHPSGKKQLDGIIGTPCPECGGVMRLRHAKNERKTAYLGCVRFPECKGVKFFEDGAKRQGGGKGGRQGGGKGAPARPMKFVSSVPFGGGPRGGSRK